MSDYSEPGYLLRVSIAIDQLIQACCNRGVLGVTISARAGTAETNRHRWGIWLSWLLDRLWPFGLDPQTLERHVVGAIKGDRWRAYYVLHSLWPYYHDSDLVTALHELLDQPEKE